MKQPQKTIETLSKNVRMLMDASDIGKNALAKKSGVSERMIGYILSQERKAFIQAVEDLAKAFGLTGWQLIMPNLQADLAKNGHLEKLINDYSKASKKGREYIDRVAEQEAKYGNGE